MSGKQAREPWLHQFVNMALGKTYRKDKLILFVVFDFLPWLFNGVMNALSSLGLQEMWELWQSLERTVMDTTDTIRYYLQVFISSLLN